MAFRDLTEFLLTKPIELPVGGKMYRFPGTVSGRTSLLLRAMQEQALAAAQAEKAGKKVDLDADVLDDLGEVNLRAELMTLDGHDVEREMAADGCDGAQIRHVFTVLTIWHMQGPEAAEQAWEQLAVDPPKPNRAARRQASSAAASGTRKPASTTGTRSRSTSRKPPAAAG